MPSYQNEYNWAKKILEETLNLDKRMSDVTHLKQIQTRARMGTLLELFFYHPRILARLAHLLWERLQWHMRQKKFNWS